MRSEAKTTGFVFPVQALCIPVALRQFLRKLRMPKDAYVFAAATREGTVFHGFKQINNLLRRNRQELCAEFLLTMPTSDPRAKGYGPPAEAEVAKMKAVLDNDIEQVAWGGVCDFHPPRVCTFRPPLTLGVHSNPLQSTPKGNLERWIRSGISGSLGLMRRVTEFFALLIQSR